MSTIQTSMKNLCLIMAAAMCVAACLLIAAPAAHAQDAVVITAQQPQLEKYALNDAFPTDPEAPATTLASGQEVMLWIASGQVALILQGPATFSIAADGDRLNVRLESGRLMVTAAQVPDEQPVHIVIGPEDDRILDMPAPPGTTVVVRAGNDLDVGWLEGDGAASTPVAMTLMGEDAELSVNEHLAIRNGEAKRDKATDWMQDVGVAATAADGLGFNSAKSWRGRVCSSLFSSLAYWDKTAQKNPELLLPTEPEQFEPEVRTVTAQINTAPSVYQSKQAPPATVSFAGANEVPAISPAAISVGGAGGVAVNNAEARSLLSLTGSRGLGFNGLSLLGIRGSSSGIRAPGPAGIGGP